MLAFLCRKHYAKYMKQEAPVSAETLTGAVITTAEAAVTCNPIIGFPAVDLKEIHSDLSQLPDRM
jgi:hypothetical protein